MEPEITECPDSARRSARRICDLAADNSVWVSGVVPALAVGSGLEFTELGTHQLKGVPDEWTLLQLVAD